MPSWAQKRTVSLKKLHTGNLSWPGDVSQSQTCNLGDQILLTLGKHAHCQLCSWCQWDFFSLGPGLPSQFLNLLLFSEQNSRRFKKGSSFFPSLCFSVSFCVCSIPVQPPTRFSVCFRLSEIIRNVFIIKPQEQQPGGFRQVRL